jgi:hypothetical protein
MSRRRSSERFAAGLDTGLGLGERVIDRKRICMRNLVVCLVVALGAVFAESGVANATILGTTMQPGASIGVGCVSSGTAVGQVGDTPSTPYIVPAPGEITQWSTNTSADTAGTPLTFLVVRPTVGSNYTVLAVDPVTLPSPLPASGVSTFTLAQPIQVQSGDTFALYSTASSGLVCLWGGESIPSGAVAAVMGPFAPPPGPGLGVSIFENVPGAELDLAVTFLSLQDVGVTTSTAPSDAAAGRPAVLSSVVTNAGPATGAITFADQVPAGLTIDSAVAGDGACSTSGQTVTCTVSGLGVGQSAPVTIVVTPTAAGSYANDVSVSTSLADPNPFNDHATATLAVTGPATTETCVVPNLRGAASRLAGVVLRDLGCEVKTTHAHSKTVHKGNVIKTSPGAGAHPFGTAVTLQISSGRSKKKHKKHPTRHPARV